MVKIDYNIYYYDIENKEISFQVKDYLLGTCLKKLIKRVNYNYIYDEAIGVTVIRMIIKISYN